MSIIRAVRTLVSGGRLPEVVRECRHCGTTVETDAETCPCCGRSALVRFEIR